MLIPEQSVDVRIPTGRFGLDGTLGMPADARGVVVFAHGSGSSRHSSRNLMVASVLRDAGFATLLFDLLSVDEAAERSNVFDIGLLADRIAHALRWCASHWPLAALPIGLFGASTGAGAALVAAARNPDVGAIVSRGGRPDLAGAALAAVTAPTLLIVGSHDADVLELNQAAFASLRCSKKLDVIPGATHLFEEPGTLELAASKARDWFGVHLARAPKGTAL